MHVFLDFVFLCSCFDLLVLKSTMKTEQTTGRLLAFLRRTFKSVAERSSRATALIHLTQLTD